MRLFGLGIGRREKEASWLGELAGGRSSRRGRQWPVDFDKGDRGREGTGWKEVEKNQTIRLAHSEPVLVARTPEGKSSLG